MGIAREAPSRWGRAEGMVAALCYASASILIMYANKAALTVFGFPSPTLLVAAQSLTTLIGLTILSAAGVVEIPEITLARLIEVQPLPSLRALEVIAGMNGTKHVNMAMFTALRRFSIPMIMALEYLFRRELPSRGKVGWTLCMLVGAFVAIANDLTFNEWGYFSVMANNLLTATVAIYTHNKSKGMGITGTLYFTNLSYLPLVGMCILIFEPEKIPQSFDCPCWESWVYLGCFVASCGIGGALSYANIWSNKLNGAATTAVVGCLKNTITSYGGMLPIWGDFKFDFYNFVGVNISLAAGIGFSMVDMQEKLSKQREARRLKGEEIA